ncbi:MAG: hypothetical protein R3E39_23655 [Anaerolineae bacterium]
MVHTRRRAKVMIIALIVVLATTLTIVGPSSLTLADPYPGGLHCPGC